MCKKSGLDRADMDDMTIGMCLDFIEEYIDYQKPNEKKAKKASQKDFDSF
jgi:hypothetical protein